MKRTQLPNGKFAWPEAELRKIAEEVVYGLKYTTVDPDVADIVEAAVQFGAAGAKPFEVREFVQSRLETLE